MLALHGQIYLDIQVDAEGGKRGWHLTRASLAAADDAEDENTIEITHEVSVSVAVGTLQPPLGCRLQVPIGNMLVAL